MELKMDVTQNLNLSQRMIQSTQILQMSSVELETYLKELAVENPVIDIEDREPSPSKEDDMSRKLEWLESTDEQNRVYYNDEYGGEDSDERDMWNFSTDQGEALSEYLEAQLVPLHLSEKEHEMAVYMIDLLDTKGYFEESAEQVAEVFTTDLTHVLKVLSLIQSFDPAGVGARNLSECLLIQMDRLKMKDSVARTIATEYLELLGKNQIPQIARKMKISTAEVMDALEVIKELNPKPGSGFSSRENLKYVIPDVTVVKLKGYYEILLNEYLYPKVSINSYYHRMMTKDKSRETRNYISDKVKQAEWVMNCISRRSTTLMDVSKTIVDMQEKFFANGPGHLMPMKLADVATLIGMHESTVSRAIKDKFLQCSWGVYPLNYFFSKGVSSLKTDARISQEAVVGLIREIIAGENRQKPYSDRILMEELNKRGVDISRRTVAKYREAAGIRDASGRKAF